MIEQYQSLRAVVDLYSGQPDSLEGYSPEVIKEKIVPHLNTMLPKLSAVDLKAMQTAFVAINTMDLSFEDMERALSGMLESTEGGVETIKRIGAQLGDVMDKELKAIDEAQREAIAFLHNQMTDENADNAPHEKIEYSPMREGALQEKHGKEIVYSYGSFGAEDLQVRSPEMRLAFLLRYDAIKAIYKNSNGTMGDAWRLAITEDAAMPNSGFMKTVLAEGSQITTARITKEIREAASAVSAMPPKGGDTTQANV